MGTNYILVYRTDCGDNSPLGSVVVRFFNKKENARKAMEAAYQVEEAYQRAKAAMHDPNNPMRDDYSVDRSRSSITIHAGMDTFHWEIMAAKSEDTDDAKRAADKRRDRTGSRTEGHTEKPDKETEYEGLYFDSRAGH